MAYTPINWQTGDTITAEKLNRCDNGWSVTNGSTTICDETITAVDDGGMYCAQLSVTSITAPTITVTYDGTPYQCARDGDGGYGTDTNFTFTDYPFRIEGDGFVVTETVGSHTVKIEALASAVDVGNDFVAAVTDAAPLFRVMVGSTTWQEVHDAVSVGKFAYVPDEDSGDVFCYPVVSVTHGSTYQVATLQKSSSDVMLRYYIADTADGPIYAN